MREMIRANAGLLFAGVATFALMGAGQSLYGPALPAFARDLGLSVEQAAGLVSAHWIGCAVGVAIMFFRGAGVTPRAVLLGMVAGAGVIAAGPGLWGTLAGAVIFGAGYGAATVVFNPRVLGAFGSRGTSMLSLLNACFGVGAIAAPLVFVAIGSDPGLAFALVAGFAALIWLGAGPAGRRQAAGTARATQPFRVRPGILVFGVVGIGLEACLIGLGPTALIAAGEPEVRAAGLLSVFFVAFLGARVVLVFTAHLIGSFTLYVGAMAGAALSGAVAVLISPAVGFVAMGAFSGLIFPGFYVTAQRIMGDDPRVAPTIIASGLIGGIASPVVLGAVMGFAGERGFFWIVAGVALIMTCYAASRMRAINRS